MLWLKLGIADVKKILDLWRKHGISLLIQGDKKDSRNAFTMTIPTTHKTAIDNEIDDYAGSRDDTQYLQEMVGDADHILGIYGQL